MHPPSLRSKVRPGGEGAENTRKRGLGKACHQGGDVGSGKLVGAVDFGFLESFAAGDTVVVAEVLQLYCREARVWAAKLEPDDPNWRDLIHTIKGASRGVGAVALGDLCAAAELGGPSKIAAVATGLAAAVAEIEAYQAARSRL